MNQHTLIATRVPVDAAVLHLARKLRSQRRNLTPSASHDAEIVDTADSLECAKVMTPNLRVVVAPDGSDCAVRLCDLARPHLSLHTPTTHSGQSERQYELEKMADTHPNVALLSRFDPANIADMADIVSEDFVWHFFNPILPELQGDYAGLTGLKEFFESIQKCFGGTFQVTPVSLIPAGDELVVAIVKDTMVREGHPIEVDAVVVWRMVDGKIAEAWDIPAVNTIRGKS